MKGSAKYAAKNRRGSRATEERGDPELLSHHESGRNSTSRKASLTDCWCISTNGKNFTPRLLHTER